MTTRKTAAGTVSVALLMALSGAGPAIAQAPTEIDTITVVAPRITYQTTRERARGSVVPQEVTLAKKSALVAFGDLDLTRTADLYQLEDRVDKAAARVCGELAQEFPEGTPSTDICTRRAIEDAMAQVQLRARQAARPGASATARDEGGN